MKDYWNSTETKLYFRGSIHALMPGNSRFLAFQVEFRNELKLSKR